MELCVLSCQKWIPHYFLCVLLVLNLAYSMCLHCILNKRVGGQMDKRMSDGKQEIWWLILYFNLTEPWGTQIFGQTLFFVCLWVCLWMRLTFESVNWVKQIAPAIGGGPHPINWSPELNKKMNPLSSKREFFLSICLWTGTLFHPSFKLELKLWIFLGLEPTGL